MTARESAQVSFSGTQFTLTYTEMNDRGMLDVYIDGSKAATINESGPGKWQQTWMSGLLAAGTHTVRFRHAAGTVADIDAITVMP
jgi:hypothetical protein